MATIQETIRSEMTTAWKGGQNDRRDALRLLLAAFKNAEIDLGHTLTDDETVRVLQKEAKQRRDSIVEYEKASRADLVAKEQIELVVIEEFLPAQLSDEELQGLAQSVIAEVGAAGPSDVGKVMRPLLERVAGRADGGRVNQAVREILAG
ncbi:MAG: GatB/YqeY domain-containing protein [Chloroflexi bacterium]|nr:GatB/YqeY domain-containing protein [Chloroflexota bacterium]MQC16940.1 GatB/YqeY domain-containing protein [Chloroflexota bacterium]